MKKVILALVIVFSLSSFTTNLMEIPSSEVVPPPSCFELAVDMYEIYVNNGIDPDQAESAAMGWLTSCEISRYILGVE